MTGFAHNDFDSGLVGSRRGYWRDSSLKVNIIFWLQPLNEVYPTTNDMFLRWSTDDHAKFIRDTPFLVKYSHQQRWFSKVVPSPCQVFPFGWDNEIWALNMHHFLSSGHFSFLFYPPGNAWWPWSIAATFGRCHLLSFWTSGRLCHVESTVLRCGTNLDHEEPLNQNLGDFCWSRYCIYLRLELLYYKLRWVLLPLEVGFTKMFCSICTLQDGAVQMVPKSWSFKDHFWCRIP